MTFVSLWAGVLSLCVGLQDDVSQPPLPAGSPANPQVPSAVSPELSQLAEQYNRLEQQLLDLAQRHREAVPAEQTDIRRQITRLTDQQFELREQSRRREVQRLKKRLANVEETLRQRQELKDDIVQRRVTDLLSAGDNLRWEPLRVIAVPIMQHTLQTRDSIPASVSPTEPQPGGPPSPAYSRNWPALPGPASVGNERVGGGPVSRVPEAKSELEFAQRELERVSALSANGVIGVEELSQAEQRVRRAQLAVSRAEADFEAVRQLLQLDLQKAELEQRAAQRALQVAENEQATRSDIEKRQTEYELKELALYRAKALLDMHTQSAQRAASVSPDPAAKSSLSPNQDSASLTANLLQGDSVAVAELKADLQTAEQALTHAERMFQRGYISADEFDAARKRVHLAELKLHRARAELDSRQKLAELAVREAELELKAAQKVVEEMLGTNRRNSGSTTSAEIDRAKTDVQRKELAVERARIFLEANRASDGATDSSDG